MKILGTVLFCLLFLNGCISNTESKNKKIITVSIEPLRYVVSAITGDQFTVQTLVPKGGNPETYEPKPSQMADLQYSTLYCQIGELGFEKVWKDKIAKQSPHLLICNTSSNIDLIGEGDHFDPHIWASPRNMSLMVDLIYHQLCIIDKVNTPLYKENYQQLQKRLYQIDDSICSILEGKTPAFMAYHPTLSYFARDYGLKQIAIEEHGKEPSTKKMQDLITEARKEKVKIIFIQKEFDTRYAELIAKEIQAKVVQIDPLSADWEGEMIRIAKLLKDGEETTN